LPEETPELERKTSATEGPTTGTDPGGTRDAEWKLAGTFVASAGKLGHFPMETLPAGSYGDRLATGRCSNRTARLQMRTSQQ
ncbi:unnamed protein product, partial [Symbiodinium microadriaticum]